MKSESAGEKPVAVAHLKNVSRADAVHRKTAHCTVLPHGDIVKSVGDANRLSSRSARTVESDDFVHISGAKSHRIFVAKIRLHREGKVLYVGESFYVLRADAFFVAAFAEKRNSFESVFNGPLKAMQLELSKLFDRHEVHGRYRMDG